MYSYPSLTSLPLTLTSLPPSPILSTLYSLLISLSSFLRSLFLIPSPLSLFFFSLCSSLFFSLHSVISPVSCLTSPLTSSSLCHHLDLFELGDEARTIFLSLCRGNAFFSYRDHAQLYFLYSMRLPPIFASSCFLLRLQNRDDRK